MSAKPRLLGLLLCCAALSFAAEHPAPPILPLSELRAGMKGQGRTVIRGITPEPFDFEILDVLQTEGFATNLILVHASGPLIERTGGVCAGMSGSPLYVGGKLIGAIAFTTPFADTRYCYATPIEDMLKVFDLAKTPARTVRGPFGALPVGTRLLVGGLRGRALARLDQALTRRGLLAVDEPSVPIKPPEPGSVPSPLDIEEGGAVAASLSTGDIVLTALGTVSYRDHDRVLAFGHPFMQRGATSLFLQPAYIYGVVPSMQLPFKVGAPAGPAVGAFFEDRSAGLAGRLSETAKSMDLTIEANDAGLGRKRTMHVKLVQDPELAPTLVAVSVMQAMAEVMDRAGGGTAKMTWTYAGEGLPEPLQRQDMVYDSADILSESISGPMFTLDALLRNDFTTFTPGALTIKVDVSAERQTVRLVDLKVSPKTVKPGGAVLATVRLQPYRGQAFEQKLRLTVPADAAAGNLVVDLHGRPEGLAGPLSQAVLMARGLVPPTSLRELVSALASTQRGNSLALELLTPEAYDARQELFSRLGSLPGPDLFSEEVQSLPTLGGGVTANVGQAEPLAHAEAMLDQVVQGHLRATVTVAK